MNGIVAVLVLLMSTVALAAEGHQDPVAPVLLGLVILLLSAKIGAYLVTKIHQPAVLGELLAGVILGNLYLLNTGADWSTAVADTLNYIKTSDTIDIMARIGVILLLFEVGLESSLPDLMKVGLSSMLVAVVGVIAPMVLGFVASEFLLPEHSVYAHVFVGATLCATSVGITARVLKDLNKTSVPEAKIILGAAVVDDVLGLIILAVISGVIISAGAGPGDAGLDWGAVSMIAFKALVFLVLAIYLGAKLAPHWFRLTSRLRVQGALIVASLSFCFFLSYLANAFGLATIVGAFAAGLILDGVEFAKYYDDSAESVEVALLLISRFFVPLFFVLMGMQVELSTFSSAHVILVAVVLTIVAIVGKQVCSLGVLEKGINRLAIGIGMIPRGEVGLIFASIGAGLVLKGERIIDASLYSAIVIMVMATTVVTPPLLKWSLARTGKGAEQ